MDHAALNSRVFKVWLALVDDDVNRIYDWLFDHVSGFAVQRKGDGLLITFDFESDAIFFKLTFM